MDVEKQEIEHLHEMLHILRQRRQQLELKQATYGINVPPEIIMEMNELAERIGTFKAEIKRLQALGVKDKYNRLVVFSTSDQTTELRATENGLECYVFDLRPERKSGHRWTISVDRLKDIDIRVYPSSNDNSDWGLFALGRPHNDWYHYDWYYSKSLFEREKDLYDAIRRLTEKSIELASIK